MKQTPLEEKFAPKGAMALFLLIVLYLVIWFGAYFFNA
jgi:hypothetical protein